MKERESFGSRLGFVLISAGCAIGLGNVWKFPYICGEYGGAAFIIIYLICMVLISLPILICEYAVGRSSRFSIVKAFNKLEQPGTIWHIMRPVGLIGNYFLMMFYTMISGWMLYYAYLSASGRFVGKNPDQISGIFNSMLETPSTMILFNMISIIVCFSICALGLRGGVERTGNVIMSLLILTMIILAVRSVTLENSTNGLKFYLLPDFSKVSEKGIGNTIFAAMSHSFFTLSVGIGSMAIFGSYLKKDRRLLGESLSVATLDTFVALTAGLIIIPTCFAFGIEPDAGPSLLFVTLPNVFANMQAGRLWATIFFIFMSFAATSTVIAVFENIIAMSMELFNFGRLKSVIVNFIGISLLSLPAILGFNLLSGFEPFGAGTSILDLEDFIVSYNMLPIGGLVFVLFCTHKNGWKWENFIEECNLGRGPILKNTKLLKYYMGYILPLFISVIYLKGYYDMFKDAGGAFLTGMMCIAFAVIGLVIFITVKKPKTEASK